MQSPFKFLDSYSKEDIDIFFGREKDVEEIYEKLFRNNLLIIYGASGTGKTSIINCGVANKFDADDWLPVFVRRKNNILQSIIEEVEKLTRKPVAENKSVADSVYSLYLSFYRPVYLIFDQFEELFISAEKQEQDLFISFLIELLQKEYNTKVIISVREEYLAYFSAFEEKIPDFFENRHRVEFITKLKAESIILKTCKKTNIGLAVPGNVPAKITDNIIAGAGRVELTYLQVYLDRLFNQDLIDNSGVEKVEFSEALVNKVGGITNVLSKFLEEQIDKTANPIFAWQMLKAFITENGTKKITTAESVKKYFTDNNIAVNEQEINRYIDDFLKLKIIKPVDENKTFEIMHDSLAEKVWEKVSVDDRAVLEAKSFVHGAYKNHLLRKRWLTAEDLAYIKPYTHKITVSNAENTFIKKSRQRIVRNKIAAGTIAAGIIVALSILTIYLLNAQRDLDGKNKILASQKDSLTVQKNLAYTMTDSAKKQAANALRLKLKADSLRAVAVASQETANLALTSAQKANELAQSEKDNSVKLRNQADSVLDITKMLQTNPTEAKNRALENYGLMDPLLKPRLRQTVYAAYAKILYENEAKLNVTNLQSSMVDKNGSFVIVSGKDRKLLYYDMQTRKGSKILNPHDYFVTHIVINNKTKGFATSDESGKVYFWDAARNPGNNIHNKGNPIASMVSVYDNDSLLIAYKNGDMVICDFEGKNQHKIPSTNLNPVKMAEKFNGSPGRIITVGENSTISILGLDGSVPQKLAYRPLPDEKITYADISPNGKQIAIASNKKTVIYTLSGNNKFTAVDNLKYLSPNSSITKVNFISDDEIVYVTETGEMSYYNIASGSLINVQNADSNDPVVDLLKLPGQSKFVSASRNGQIRFWNPAITQPLVFDFVYKGDENLFGNFTQTVAGKYRFEKAGKNVTLKKSETDIAQFDLGEVFSENKYMNSPSSDLRMTLSSSTSLMLYDGADRVQEYFAVLPRSVADNKNNSADNRNRELSIKDFWFSKDGKYILLKLNSALAGRTYYLIYPSFTGIIDIESNKN